MLGTVPEPVQAAEGVLKATCPASSTGVFCFSFLCRSSPLHFLVSRILQNFRHSKIDGHSFLLSSTNVFFF